MGSSIKVDSANAEKAFELEADKLEPGEMSRYLPGFTDLRKVSYYGPTGSGDVLVWYMATRVRDGKTYGLRYIERADAWDYYPFKSYPAMKGKIELVEIMAKPEIVIYYEAV